MAGLILAKTLPPLTWFRAFEAAARKLSFTAAAEELGMTQSAVSQHVKALEGRLGVALFVRRARGLSLTDDGRKLLRQLETALETLAVAARSFDTGQSQDILTVATSVSVAQWIIAPTLTAFSRRHPTIRLRFLSTIWPDDFQSVSADVEIPFGSHKQFGRNATLLEPSGLVALNSPALEGDLDTLPLIEAVGTSGGWNSWRGDNRQGETPRIFVDSFGAALTMAVHGNGVALVNEVLAQAALKQGQLIRAHGDSVPCNEAYYLRIKEGNAAAAQFRDWIVEQIESNSLNHR